jgi:ATP-dependent protease ClpP protease subunit
VNLSNLREHVRARLPETITDLRALAKDRMPDTTVQREAGYTIQNAAGEEAVVRIYDEIWWLGVNAQDLTRELDAITAPSIRVEINSPGGDVFDGIAIYNALRNHPAYVTTRVDGLAASIASVIAQAGDKRMIQPAAQLMIHNAWGVTMGDTKDHAEMSDLLKQQDAVLAGIYASRSGRPADGFRDLMNAETWLTAEAAIEAGLADEVFDPAPKQKTDASSRRTLLDQISDAVDAVTDVINSAEQVSALRTAAGKELSNRNQESLVGLRDAITRLDGLLPPTPADETVEAWTQEQIDELQARVASRTA